MFSSMLFLSIVVEQPWTKFHHMQGADVAYVLGLGAVGAFFAIAMILCEFHLIMYSSAVILMIGGVIKEMITIFMGVFVFHDELNRLNLAGCFVVFLGVVFYKVSFHLDKQKERDGRILRTTRSDDTGLLPGEPAYRTITSVDCEDITGGDNDTAEAEILRSRDGIELRRGSNSNSSGHWLSPTSPTPSLNGKLLISKIPLPIVGKSDTIEWGLLTN
jgi:hypothetical protein